MSDFDFDELDKAVNSLQNGESKEEAPVGVSSETPISKPVSNTSDNSRPIPSLKPAPGRKPGPFMDVMHPSSNMRSQAKNPISTNTITPNDDPASAKSDEPIQAPSESMTPQDNIANKPETQPAAENQEFDEDDDISKISEDINKTLGISGDQPASSPFINDAKVEKRPLGAFSDDNKNPETDQPATPQPNVADETLPAELDNDLLSIESNSVARSTMPEDTPAKLTDDKAENSEEKNEVQPANTTPAPATSITQQYVTKPSERDQDQKSPIYDNVETYQKTLVKKGGKAGWLWVLWILLLIIIGAGVGAAVYFFVLEP